MCCAAISKQGVPPKITMRPPEEPDCCVGLDYVIGNDGQVGWAQRMAPRAPYCLPTGVAGFDRNLHGGFFEGDLYIIFGQSAVFSPGRIPPGTPYRRLEDTGM